MTTSATNSAKPPIPGRVRTTPPRTSKAVAATANPRERANTRCASRISGNEQEGSGVRRIDIGEGSVYLAIVPIPFAIYKYPAVRLRRDRDYSADV